MAFLFSLKGLMTSIKCIIVIFLFKSDFSYLPNKKKEGCILSYGYESYFQMEYIDIDESDQMIVRTITKLFLVA